MANELKVSSPLTVANNNAVNLSDNQTTPNYVAIKAPATVSSSYNITMPSLQGSTNSVLSNSDGAGTMVWANIPLATTGDINQLSFTPANNQSSPANVTGLAFANASIRSATVQYSIVINATASLYEAGTLQLIQKGSSWEMSQTTVGDNSLIVLTVTTAGQVQYTSANYAGFSSAKMQFRATVTSV